MSSSVPAHDEATRLRFLARSVVATGSPVYGEGLIAALRGVFPGSVVLAGRGGGAEAPWRGLLSPAVYQAVLDSPQVISCFDMANDSTWCNDPLVDGGFAAFIGARMASPGEGVDGAVIVLGVRPGCFDASDCALVQVAADCAASRWLGEGERRAAAMERDEHVRHVQKMRVVANMASGVAHDFNNLLAGILGYVSHMMESEEPGPTWQEDLRTVRTAAERASHLTRQLLSFSRKRPVERKTIGLNPLIRDTVQMLRYALPKNVDVVYDLEGSIPSVDVDEGEMGQVLVNLCVNAADAMKEAGGTLTVRTSYRALTDLERLRLQGVEVSDDEVVLLDVVDTGVGMTESVMAQLFDPFFTTKGEEEGTGLGLSMVYGIVNNHGGALLVDSTLGEGSTFSVVLPAGGRLSDASGGKPVPQRLKGTERILVVDDEPEVQEVVERTLLRYGYGVDSVDDGEAALAWLASEGENVDLVLMDLSMPRLDGVETWKKMQEDHPKVPVLLMTGLEQDELYLRFLEEEGLEVLEKPFSSGELAFRLRGMLDRWE